MREPGAAGLVDALLRRCDEFTASARAEEVVLDSAYLNSGPVSFLENSKLLNLDKPTLLLARASVLVGRVPTLCKFRKSLYKFQPVRVS